MFLINSFAFQYKSHGIICESCPMLNRLPQIVLQFLFRKIIECSVKVSRKADGKLVLAFCDWLSLKGYVEAVPEDVVAARLSVTPQQLSTFCRTMLGKSFRQIRKEYRIKEAMNLLSENPDLPLEVLGESVGIPDKSNFRRQFIDVVGCAPSEWIKTRKSRLF